LEQLQQLHAINITGVRWPRLRVRAQAPYSRSTLHRK